MSVTDATWSFTLYLTIVTTTSKSQKLYKNNYKILLFKNTYQYMWCISKHVQYKHINKLYIKKCKHGWMDRSSNNYCTVCGVIFFSNGICDWLCILMCFLIRLSMYVSHHRGKKLESVWGTNTWLQISIQKHVYIKNNTVKSRFYDIVGQLPMQRKIEIKYKVETRY